MAQHSLNQSPSNPRRLQVAKIPWEDSVWFSDIDDTLIDTMSASMPASMGVKQVLTGHCGEAGARKVQTGFNRIFQLMIEGHRVRSEDDWRHVEGGKQAFEDLLERIAAVQTQVQNEYSSIKKWSREVFVKLAADSAGVSVTPELVHEAADAYWLTLTEHIKIFPDALQLADTIAEHHRPLFLITSSDARLSMQSDGQFTYDPHYSEALKRQRIELLRSRGLKYATVSIGDPEDKPHLDFFAKGIKMAEAELGHPIALANAIMLGDSFSGDLQIPKDQLSFGLVVLRQSQRQQLHVDDSHQISVGNVHDATRYIA